MNDVTVCHTRSAAVLLTLTPRSDMQALLHALQKQGVKVRVEHVDRNGIRLSFALPQGLRAVDAGTALESPYGGLSLGRHVGDEVFLFLPEPNEATLRQLIQHPVQILLAPRTGRVRMTVKAPREVLVIRGELAARHINQEQQQNHHRG